MKFAYYNEYVPEAAEWLRNLIAAGHIAPGFVDERSIEDVMPSDLDGFIQCHFFAGIGIWSHALRRAGWSDDRPVWTGSCPCQPFSAAGAGAGFDDERHLWPAFHHLIKECRPSVIFGEQVASKAVEPWIDLVHADVEALGYTFGCVPFPAASVGAPHIRDRAYWVADSAGAGSQRRDESRQRVDAQRPAAQRNGEDGGLADANHDGHSGSKSNQAKSRCDQSGIWVSDRGHSLPEEQPSAGPTNGHWRDADWLLCRDGKWRPVEPGTFPLVNGTPARLVRLRAYGNAINAESAVAFIESFG